MKLLKTFFVPIIKDSIQWVNPVSRYPVHTRLIINNIRGEYLIGHEKIIFDMRIDKDATYDIDLFYNGSIFDEILFDTKNFHKINFIKSLLNNPKISIKRISMISSVGFDLNIEIEENRDIPDIFYMGEKIYPRPYRIYIHKDIDVECNHCGAVFKRSELINDLDWLWDGEEEYPVGSTTTCPKCKETDCVDLEYEEL